MGSLKCEWSVRFATSHGRHGRGTPESGTSYTPSGYSVVSARSVCQASFGRITPGH